MDQQNLTPAQKDLINAAVRETCVQFFETFKRQLVSHAPIIDQEYLDVDQAAQYLKIKKNTLYAKVKYKEITFSRSGQRKLLFSKKDLDVYIMSHRVKSNSEISAEAEIHTTKKRFSY